MTKEEFIDLKMKLSKEDIIYDYYATEEKLIEKLGIEHENYELKQENKQLKECYCNRTDCSGRIKNSREYDSLYQKYKSSSNNSCVTKEKNIVGKNLLEGTYFDGNGIPKMIGITKAEYLEYKKLQQENQQLKSILVELKETIKNKIKGFKEDKDYFIDEKDMYELDNLIQKLKEK